LFYDPILLVYNFYLYFISKYNKFQHGHKLNCQCNSYREEPRPANAGEDIIVIIDDISKLK